MKMASSALRAKAIYFMARIIFTSMRSGACASTAPSKISDRRAPRRWRYHIYKSPLTPSTRQRASHDVVDSARPRCGVAAETCWPARRPILMISVADKMPLRFTCNDIGGMLVAVRYSPLGMKIAHEVNGTCRFPRWRHENDEKRRRRRVR